MNARLMLHLRVQFRKIDSNDFDGIQPTLRHVPPGEGSPLCITPSSIHTTESPFCAARKVPLSYINTWPTPITATSKIVLIGAPPKDPATVVPVIPVAHVLPPQCLHGFLTIDNAMVIAEARYIMGRITTWPFSATGRDVMACIPRMADCGGLMIGVDIIEPKSTAVGDRERAAL